MPWPGVALQTLCRWQALLTGARHHCLPIISIFYKYHIVSSIIYLYIYDISPWFQIAMQVYIRYTVYNGIQWRTMVYSTQQFIFSNEMPHLVQSTLLKGFGWRRKWTGSCAYVQPARHCPGNESLSGDAKVILRRCCYHGGVRNLSLFLTFSTLKLTLTEEFVDWPSCPLAVDAAIPRPLAASTTHAQIRRSITSLMVTSRNGPLHGSFMATGPQAVCGWIGRWKQDVQRALPSNSPSR